MNQPSETSRNPDAIRSDIDTTRQRMDETIGAIGERLQGRHLLDEILGLFRSSDGQPSRIKEKISNGASSAMHSVVDTVKNHPIPTLLIGSGIAWLIYENRRSKSQYVTDPDFEYNEYGYGSGSVGLYATGEAEIEYGTTQTPSEFGDASGFGSETGASGTSSKLGELKGKVGEKASHAKESIRNAASRAGERARHGAQAVKSRASEIGSRVQERSREIYGRSREQVSSTVNQHPLEVGLGCLAVGLLVGLALPTPRKINELAGPTADRLRQRARDTGRDLVERGKTVAQAAANAVREEARSQGLTPEALRQKAGAVADRGKQAAAESAREEGIAPEGVGAGGAQQNEPQPVVRSIV